MRFEVVRDIQTVRLQTDIAAGNVTPTYGKSHCTRRSLDSARNDNRAALRPRFRGFKGQEKVLKFDRPLAGRFLGLTGLWPEGCGIAASGHACGVRVQKVLRVLRFDSANGQSIKRKALLWAGYGPTSTDLHILCRMCTA